MKLTEIKTAKSVLSKEIGWSWIALLVKCLIRKKSVFSNTHWINERGAESKFVKRLSFASAMYLELRKKFGRERTFEIIRSVLIPIGCNEQWEHLKTLEISGDEPMKWLMAFNDLMDKVGTPRFNRRKYVKQNDNICHFVITRCVFNDFFTEAGTPELTKLFCDVDRKFFPEAFPDFRFHRGTSWENTIAYGRNQCEFIFERRE